MRPRLRLFTGEDDVALEPEPTISMTMGEFSRILSDACRYDSTWLRDFQFDEVRVSEDLHEVLTTYWHLRPGA